MAFDFADLGEVVGGPLGGSNRSTVHRVRAGNGTVVVKRFATPDEGFPREAAALGVLPPDAPAPKLIGVQEEPPMIVLSDAGRGPSVADALLGDDREVARAAVLSWAATVARLHDSTVDLGADFRVALAARTGQPVSEMTGEIEKTISALGTHGADLGVPVPVGAAGELRGLGARLATGPRVLSPGDTCPDNNVATPGGRVLLDFESAQWQNPAWDVAYLLVPWPSCWCSWRLPSDVAEEALARYRADLAMPWADFRADVAAAATVWAMVSTAQLLGRALGDDPPPADPAKRMPTRRAMILNRLASVPGDQLGAFAGELRAALVARWGEVPLAYAPAFA